MNRASISLLSQNYTAIVCVQAIQQRRSCSSGLTFFGKVFVYYRNTAVVLPAFGRVQS